MTPDELDKAIRKAENHVAFYTAEVNRLETDERPRLEAKVVKAEAAVEGARQAIVNNAVDVDAARANLAAASERLAELRQLVAASLPPTAASGAAFDATVRIEEGY